LKKLRGSFMRQSCCKDFGAASAGKSGSAQLVGHDPDRMTNRWARQAVFRAITPRN
jgi:hypothetical protein